MKGLVIYASFGSGHKRAAEAIVESFQDRGISVDCRDLLEFLPSPMRRFYSDAYVYMITSSRRLWRLTYNMMNAPRWAYTPGKSWTQKWQFPRLKKFLQQENFTHILSTHFTPSALLADWRTSGEILRGETFSIITDHEAHRCWRRTGLNHYFVPSDKVADEMHSIGVPEPNITVSGIPVSKVFSSGISRAQARKNWELPESATIALVLCSAVTTAKSLQMLREFASVDREDLQFIVLAGADSKKEKAIKERFAADSRFQVFGFTKKMDEFMKASDFIVTKPGGLIVSEALASGLPQILLEPIPGQEEANAKYAEENGAAVCCMTHEKGIFSERLEAILHDPLKLHQMRESARKMAKPNAASLIAETILSRIVVSSG